MSEPAWTDDELIAWLDEQLPAERMTDLEAALRDSEPLRTRLSNLSRGRDLGNHSVGSTWRRRRISCPGRTELGSYLLGTLTNEAADYIEFHVRTVGCRLCAASLDDLEAKSRNTEETQTRRRRFFQSSAGYLQPDAESQ